jgi:hypothetical protein
MPAWNEVSGSGEGEGVLLDGLVLGLGRGGGQLCLRR